MSGTPSESAVYVLWHMFGSFVLFRTLDAVVAMAAAEEIGEAFTVSLEVLVALVAAVGAGAVAASPVGRPEESDSSGFSAEKSSCEAVY